MAGASGDDARAWMTRLEAKKTVLLRVPSTIVPETLHPDAKNFRVAETPRCPFDGRPKK